MRSLGRPVLPPERARLQQMARPKAAEPEHAEQGGLAPHPPIFEAVTTGEIILNA
jgi:hypothetical protein